MRISSMQIQQVAKAFWKASLLEIKFPISTTLLEQAILLTEPIAVIKLNKLNLLEISKYFTARGNSISCPLDNKELYGFILSHNGYTYIFLNGTESVQEQRFTLAHEFAHYLSDYKLPRQSIIEKCGVSIIEALNNKRHFTTEEKLLALVQGYSLKAFTYLLDASATSAFERLHVWKAENKADELAMEILAPYTHILQDINRDSIVKSFSSLQQYLPKLLQVKYGFTINLARLYGKSLAARISGGLSLAEKWRI